METLKAVTELEPEHVSVYSLIIEEGTPFYQLYHEEAEERARTGEGQAHLCSEDEERRMYHDAEKFLAERGYGRYEISNYAKPGRECKHNMVYWQRGWYLGVGLGAASLMWDAPERTVLSHKEISDVKAYGVRFSVTSDLQDYLAGNHAPRDVEELSLEDAMSEFAFLGLRLKEGIDTDAFAESFGVSFEQVYGETVEKLLQQDLVLMKKNRLKLSEKGTDVANIVFAEFL